MQRDYHKNWIVFYQEACNKELFIINQSIHVID